MKPLSNVIAALALSVVVGLPAVPSLHAQVGSIFQATLMEPNQ
jgi:hypothetical protein